MLAAARPGIRKQSGDGLPALFWQPADRQGYSQQSGTPAVQSPVITFNPPERFNGSAYVPLPAGLTTFGTSTNPLRFTWSGLDANSYVGSIQVEIYNPTTQQFDWQSVAVGGVYSGTSYIESDGNTALSGYVTTGGVRYGLTSPSSPTTVDHFVYYTKYALAGYWSDNFNRADGPLTSPWVVRAAGTHTLTSGAATAAVVSNRARITGDAVESGSAVQTVAYVNLGAADIDLSVTWSAISTYTTGNGVLLRGDSTDVGSYYFARPNELSYIQSGSGSSTVVSYTETFVAGDTMRITIDGREFRIYRNGTLVGTRGAANANTLPNLTGTRFGFVGHQTFDTSTAWDNLVTRV